MRFVSGGAGVGVGVVASALLMAGCGGDTAPIVTSTPSATPTAVATPTATPDPAPSPSPMALTDDELFALMPDGADREDLFGAMVTAQFFLEQYSVMFQTGDTRVWEALSAPECGPCAEGIEGAREITADGLDVRGGEIDVDTTLTRASLESDDLAVVVLGASVSDGFVVHADGNEVQSVEAAEVLYAFELGQDGGRWRIVRMASEEQ